MDRVEANVSVSATPVLPMRGIWETIRSYILWSHERGSIQYDVMVTLILLFVFFSPKVINFKDKPIDRTRQQTGVTVTADGHGGLIYQVDAQAITANNDTAIRSQLLQIIESISGEVTISSYETQRDKSGRVQGYKVFVQR